MFSKILRQPSQLDMAFLYLQKDQILCAEQTQSLLVSEEEIILSTIKNQTYIDFFCEPPQFRPRKIQNRSNEETEVQNIGQNQQSYKKQLQVNKEAEMTREHINEINVQTRRRASYPTKNFLPAFKPSFISYLANHFDEKYFNSIPIIERIQKKKNAITLKDYQELFCFEEFRPILECYFADREIYRYLMMSRIDQKNKKVYLNKIHVFERAFNMRVFDKIN